MKTRFIRPKRHDESGRAQPRTCTNCGTTYFRRNLTEVWDTRNPGHRIGWHKTIAKLCMKCMTVQQAQRVLLVAHVAAPPAKKAESA